MTLLSLKQFPVGLSKDPNVQWSTQTICLSSVEHHMVCYVVFLGCTSLSRHGGPLICCTGPIINEFTRKEVGYSYSYLQLLQQEAACSTEQVSIKWCSHRRCCVPHRSTRRVNILEFLPRDKWFVLRNCCWEGRKKKKGPFLLFQGAF